jgi:hypothetical protein
MTLFACPQQKNCEAAAAPDRGDTGYGRRSKAGTAMARYKLILGDHLHARNLPGQQAEAAIGVATA